MCSAPPRLSASHFPLPSILPDGARDLDGAIRIEDALCFLDESFQQRHQDNINILKASLMANHLVTNMQRFKTA